MSSPSPSSPNRLHRHVPPWASAAAIVGVILLVLWIVGSLMPTASGSSALSGKPAPAIEGETADGKTFRLSEQQGKVVLVNFWATWCGPCRMEIPDLIALQREYGEKGLVVVGLSRDDSMEVVRPYVEKMGMDYPVVMAPDALMVAYGGVPALPTTFLISRNGTVAAEFVGLTPRDRLEKAIKELL